MAQPLLLQSIRNARIVQLWIYCNIAILKGMRYDSCCGTLLKYGSECTAGSTGQGCGWEVNTARGEAKCYICLKTTPTCNTSHMQYFPQCTNISGTLTGTYMEWDGKAHCALWKLKHTSALCIVILPYPVQSHHRHRGPSSQLRTPSDFFFHTWVTFLLKVTGQSWVSHVEGIRIADWQYAARGK